MNKVVIAFDVDGTLVQNGALAEHEIVANERVRNLLIALAHMKNVRIIVWSGGGELWARQAAAAIGVSKYVDEYADKMYKQCQRPECIQARKGGMYCNHHVFATELRPDIAIDDIQGCELGAINLIVREK